MNKFVPGQIVAFRGIPCVIESTESFYTYKVRWFTDSFPSVINNEYLSNITTVIDDCINDNI